MKNNEIVNWIFKEPYLVPKNSKWRKYMFITINGFFLLLLPIFALFINFPYGYICWILVFCFMFLFNEKAFHIHADRYPLNPYKEYQFNPKKDLLCEENGIYIIDIDKNDRIFTAKLKDKSLIFDMKGCFFPFTIIKAYLGRQFIIECINKFKLVSDTMAQNMDISKVFYKYNDIQIRYKTEKKTKTMFLVRNRRTKLNMFMKSINGYGYQFTYITYHGGKKRFIRINEQEFASRKDFL